MIKIDFSSAIAIYLCFSIFLVFVLWIFYNYYRNGILNETKYLQQCPYCTYLFFAYERRRPGAKRTEYERANEGDTVVTIDQRGEPGEDSDKGYGVLVCPRCRSYIVRTGSETEGA